MTDVTRGRVTSLVAIPLCAAGIGTMVVACGSDADGRSTSTSSSATPTTTTFEYSQTAPPTTPEAAGACPAPAPAAGVAPEWTLAGATGSVAIVGATDTTAPSIKVTAPFRVTETEVHTLRAGDGPVVDKIATVSVCYAGVNGRDGSVFDSTYQSGAPVYFGLDGVVPGFQKAIAGQKVGSTVAVAMVPADGYPEGQPSVGIQPGDTLIFAIKILDVGA